MNGFCLSFHSLSCHSSIQLLKEISLPFHFSAMILSRTVQECTGEGSSATPNTWGSTQNTHSCILHTLKVLIASNWIDTKHHSMNEKSIPSCNNHFKALFDVSASTANKEEKPAQKRYFIHAKKKGKIQMFFKVISPQRLLDSQLVPWKIIFQ